jgi:uncharacterized protein
MTTAASSGGSPPASERDREDLERLIGRPSRTAFAVAVRCPHGRPAVTENAPLDLTGRPFPTRHWLACRALGEAVSRLEAAGGVRQLEEDPRMDDALAAAHRRHADRHGGHRVAGVGDPRRVKCLHAQLAAALAEGGGPVADWIGARIPLRWPARCCLDAERPGARA